MRFVTTPRLPKEYLELDYIESTGTQYIDTGVSMSNTHKFVFKAELNKAQDLLSNYNTSYSNCIICGYDATKGNLFTWYCSSAGTGSANERQALMNTTATLDKECIFTYETTSASITYNGTTITSPTGSTRNPSTNTQSFWLFKTKEDKRPENGCKLAYLQMYSDGTLVRNFIPAKRVSDSAIGLYDLVNSVFYENKGSGTFTAGPITHKQRLAVIPTKSNLDVPTGFKRLEYIEGTGTQYIQSDLSMPDGFHAKGKVLFDNASSTYSIIGAYDAKSPYYRNYFVIGPQSGEKWLIGFGGSAYQYFGSVSANTEYTFDISNVLSKEHLIINGSTVAVSMTGTVGTKTSTKLPIMALYSGDSDSINCHMKGRMYYLKVYDKDEVLVGNFIPVQRISDGSIGMYDSVTQAFFGNAGSGVFTAGNEVKEVEYIESSGNGSTDGQYIDTGWKYDSSKLPIEIEASFTFTELSKGTVYGLQSSNYFNWIYPMYSTSGSTSVVSYIGSISNKGFFTRSTGTKYNTKVTLTSNTVTRTVNDVTDSYSYTPNINTDASMFVFAGSHGTRVDDCTCIKMYSFSIKENGTLVRNFIPVKVGTEYAMLDSVNNIIYKNAGSGSFSGKEKTYPKRFLACPKETYSNKYIRLEYLESTGTQCIDTGVTLANNNIGTKITCSFTDMPSAMSPFGAPGYYGLNIRSSGTVIYWNGGGYPVSDGGNIVNKKYVFTLNYKGDLSFTKDGVAYKSDLPAYGFKSGTVYLFAYRPNVQPLYGRIYSCELLSGDTLIRDFIPVKRIDGVLGMYDRVNHTFYSNAGSGTFTAGPVVTKQF